MEIVGHGFLAGHLRTIADEHPTVVALAAGVSAANDTSHREFGREAELLYEIARKCEATGRKLVFFSTAATGMYSVPGAPGREDGPVFPCTPYGRHKLALEAVLSSTQVDYLVLRLAHVVGPRQPPHQLLPALAEQLCTGAVRIHQGAQRDLIDIDDVVPLVDALLRVCPDRTVVNVASGHGNDVEAIVDHMQRRLGTPARREFVPGTTTGAQRVSIDRLRTLVPAVAGLGFGPDYFRTVLDKYVPGYAAAHRIRNEGAQR
jgi:nucleoside-diphosphate-sugar epimerase